MTIATALSDKLKKAALAEPRAYIAGEWRDKVTSGKTFDVVNPATGDVIATLPDCGKEEVEEAVAAAYEAQKAWAKKTGKERAQILRKLYDLMVENADDLAVILTAEMGKPLAEARGEVLYGAAYIEWFGEEAKRAYGDIIPGHQADKRIMVIRQPVGVVGAITPWNFPNAMLARKMAPALAAGCSIVSKPAQQTPLSALSMALLAERAGLPKGLLSVVTSTSSSTVGKVFSEDDRVRKITFTGSTEVGRILMRQGADQIKKMGLELGGNAPFIVFDDADLDAAVEGAIASKFRNAGQTCVCANRLYVQAGVYDAFAEKLSKRVAGLKVGGQTGGDGHRQPCPVEGRRGPGRPPRRPPRPEGRQPTCRAPRPVCDSRHQARGGHPRAIVQRSPGARRPIGPVGGRGQPHPHRPLRRPGVLPAFPSPASTLRVHGRGPPGSDRRRAREERRERLRGWREQMEV